MVPRRLLGPAPDPAPSPRSLAGSRSGSRPDLGLGPAPGRPRTWGPCPARPLRLRRPGRDTPPGRGCPIAAPAPPGAAPRSLPDSGVPELTGQTRGHRADPRLDPAAGRRGLVTALSAGLSNWTSLPGFLASGWGAAGSWAPLTLRSWGPQPWREAPASHVGSGLP
ncbi:translation initiation factor IF-2-like [Trachypithecus francoisi]|uniref:translation initiation factor IF-2-like n=1 Tax=Trachypithecus francoisi TaxID=54180 RepID=UPI00141AFECD|nr:translation initiation factor IF-2-like [Trachypithecus francoisi]